MNPPSHPVLDLRGVVQAYAKPEGGVQRILDGIDLRVDTPQFISVVGPSGCGKSTLLRIILGSECAQAGIVRTRGKDIDHPDRDRGIVFQKYSLFPHLTVLDNVMFGLELDGTWLLQKWLTWPSYRSKHYQRHREQAMEYLAKVRLEAHADKYPQQLSGGMQQRVAIAQAMVMRPEILLMDEPFGALDPGTREELQLSIIETFQSQQITVFFVTHDLEEALFVGGRLIVLSPYWCHDDQSPGTGARIVMDLPTPAGARTADFALRESPDFQAAVNDARCFGFDPHHHRRVLEFRVDA